MAMQLTLKSDLESVDFVNDANAKYYLLDDTFSAPPPNPIEIRSSGGSGRVLSRSYDNRTVTFSYMVKGSTYEDVMASISKVFRIIEFASQEHYLDGASYIGTMNFSAGSTTGDNGVILRVKAYTPASPASLEKEDGTTYTDTRTYTFKVISGSQEVSKLFNSAAMGSSKFAYDVRVTLICEPYALGDSRVIAQVDAPGLGTIPSQASDYINNKIIIDGSLIPGDAPALTRISTAITASEGIIMGRDAGNSLINSPSYPNFFGTGRNDIVVTGICESTTEYICRVKISTAGSTDEFIYSTNDGSSWSSAQQIVPHKKFAIGATGAYVYFFTKTGHVLNDYWRFKTNQSYVVAVNTGAVTIGNQSSLYTRAGTDALIAASAYFNLNIPQKARGKYKVIADVEIGNSTNKQGLEIRMGTRFLGYKSSNGTVISSRSSLFDWARIDGLVDLGTLDLTPSGLPASGHPGSSFTVRCEIIARANYRYPTNTTLAIKRIGIFPCSDADSFLWVGWTMDGYGREVYCNYDYKNPYIAEVSAGYADKENLTDALYTNYTTIELDDVNAIGLDETHVGNVLTLVPGVKNTLVFAPTAKVTDEGYYRSFYFYWSGGTCSQTGSTIVAIRPRYLLVG